MGEKEPLYIIGDPWKNARHYQKITKAKNSGSVTQMIECLPSKPKALSLNPVPLKQNKNKQKKIYYMA
jgi:hypothetical protein